MNLRNTNSEQSWCMAEIPICASQCGEMSKPKKISIVGSGNWATAIARIVGLNAKYHDNLHDIVTMYVYEEMIDGRKLTDIINEDHENVKYLPGYEIPDNVVAVPDVALAAKDADAIIFVVPHQFIKTLCANLFGKIKPTASALTLVKGFETAEDGGIELLSILIQKLLRINVSVLMGANLANEVAAGKFAEATLGCPNKQISPLWCSIMNSEDFKVTVTDDMIGIEVYSGLKNVIAIGAGIIDGFNYGHNTKATYLRLGILEMIKFVDIFFPGGKLSTVFESCGIADLITTCYGGRNRRIGEAFVKVGKDIKTLEKELLQGQQLQGPGTAAEVNVMLKNRNMEHRFPIMTAIHKICLGELPPQDLLVVVKGHPEPWFSVTNTSF